MFFSDLSFSLLYWQAGACAVVKTYMLLYIPLREASRIFSELHPIILVPKPLFGF